MAPGTGKTLTAIRYAQPRFRWKLIVCRRDDFLTWQTELESEGVPEWLAIDKPTDVSKFDPECHQWCMVTYDSFKNLEIQNFIRMMSWHIVFADESHYIKRHKSARTQAVIKHTRHVPRRVPMTGSAVTNDPIDVFAQMLFCDDGETFGNNEWKFRNKYYSRVGYSWYRYKNAPKKIAAALADKCVYLHEDDVLKLPPRRNVAKGAQMSPKQRAEYERVLNEWEHQLESGEVKEIDHVTVQLGVLRQLSSGFIYEGEGKDRKARWLSDTKVKTLVDLINELPDSKLVVWCAFTAEIERISEWLTERNIGNVKFYGPSGKAGKRQARIDFRDSPHIRVFVGQVDSGVGMNELIGANTAIYFSNSFRVVSRQQSERRTRRRGSERHKLCTFYDIITEGSVDNHVRLSVIRKMNAATSLLNMVQDGQRLREILS